MTLRIGIVVGENSGDNLAAALIAALKNLYSNLEVEGIVGPKLINLGCKQLFPMERLAVMGLVEPLLRLPELLKIRRWLLHYFVDEPIDLFIGVDAPEFNLGLEYKLKQAGIPTVHYVSPSVWAWREGRIHTIKKAVDLMLTLFPFEESYYQQHKVPVKFVGHVAADQIPLYLEVKAAKLKLGYQEDDCVVALMPGSRNSELKHLAKLYLQTAKLCMHAKPNLKFVIPLVSLEHQAYVNKLQAELAEPPIHIYTAVGATYDLLAASDVVLVTSGTATLEVMLHKKPMVIAYKTNWLTYAIIKQLIKVPFIGLPNLLAKEAIVPELIQQYATTKNLSEALLGLLNSKEKRQLQTDKFLELHKILRQNASINAAHSIANMLGVN